MGTHFSADWVLVTYPRNYTKAWSKGTTGLEPGVSDLYFEPRMSLLFQPAGVIEQVKGKGWRKVWLWVVSSIAS